MSILYAWIFILSISLTIAVQLDENCVNSTQCDGTSNIICQNGKCQCDAPSYKPCKSSCETNSVFAYEGDDCRVDENCIKNAICRAGKCQCMQDYMVKNGVCFKNINATCTNDTECASDYCSNSRCTCAPGYELNENSTNCRRKLVNIYNTWNEANAAKAFCLDKAFCIDILAECYNDTTQPTSKFCKCPIGYTPKDNKRCEAIKGELLSPLDSIPPNYGECGFCEDDNAACITAGNRTTCWCRIGYVKRGNKCGNEQRTKPLIIFPNSNDLSQHDFKLACTNELNETNQIKNELCVCTPGYEFIAKDQPCVKIQRNWINNTYEYGLCTRINSRDEAIGENGICPKPLECQVRNDKHVCSCGQDKFRDLDDPTQCVLYIGKTANSTDDKCPTKNAEQNTTSNICECLVGYKATNENRQCEIKLSSDFFQSSCNSDRSNDNICQNLFGNKALLCTIGECRCSGNESFPNNDKTHCYAPVNQSLASPMENCPLYSTVKVDRCECNAGYRPSNNLRECVRLEIQLSEYAVPSTNINGDLTTEDCQNLFTGPVESYENVRCQCRNNAFINDDKNGCWYKLNITLSRPDETNFCPPNSRTGGVQQCQCNDGFTRDNNKCVQMTTQVYVDNDPATPNIIGITETACVKFFGLAAMKSTNGDYCVCRENAYAVNSNTYCHFLINIPNIYSKSKDDCPANTIDPPASPPSACECKPGYYVSSSNRTCEPRTSNIDLSGTIDRNSSSTTNCVNLTNDDCVARYGEPAFCQDEKCFCNRNLSFINADGKCESLSNYIFPGEHELSFYSCNTEKDCGGKAKVICDYFDNNSGYKVCKCQDGSLLNPKSQTCESRCTNCNEAANFECRDYQCNCKSGYYQTGTVCENTAKLQLNQPCNGTNSREPTVNDSLVCDPICERVQCKVGYRPENSSCVRYQLNNDRCVHQEYICTQIDINSICNKDENKCSCGPSYYQSGDICAKVVGSSCTNDEECGSGAICKGKRCDCKDEQQLEDITDTDGRPIRRCKDNGDNGGNGDNGIDQIRFNPVLLLFFILARIFLM